MNAHLHMLFSFPLWRAALLDPVYIYRGQSASGCISTHREAWHSLSISTSFTVVYDLAAPFCFLSQNALLDRRDVRRASALPIVARHAHKYRSCIMVQLVLSYSPYSHVIMNTLTLVPKSEHSLFYFYIFFQASL